MARLFYWFSYISSKRLRYNYKGSSLKHMKIKNSDLTSVILLNNVVMHKGFFIFFSNVKYRKNTFNQQHNHITKLIVKLGMKSKCNWSECGHQMTFSTYFPPIFLMRIKITILILKDWTNHRTKDWMIYLQASF